MATTTLTLEHYAHTVKKYTYDLNIAVSPKKYLSPFPLSFKALPGSLSLSLLIVATEVSSVCLR